LKGGGGYSGGLDYFNQVRGEILQEEKDAAGDSSANTVEKASARELCNLVFGLEGSRAKVRTGRAVEKRLRKTETAHDSREAHREGGRKHRLGSLGVPSPDNFQGIGVSPSVVHLKVRRAERIKEEKKSPTPFRPIE